VPKLGARIGSTDPISVIELMVDCSEYTQRPRLTRDRTAATLQQLIAAIEMAWRHRVSLCQWPNVRERSASWDVEPARKAIGWRGAST
jgi:hypothetical protein